MTYLDSSDYEAFGLEATTLTSWVAAASALMDAHCRRATLSVAQYTERQRLDGRNTFRLTYLPLATVAPASTPLVIARGRYGMPRRGDDSLDFTNQIATAFSLPGTWTAIDPSNIDFEPNTGELFLPINPLGLLFNEIEITYNAGLIATPDGVKAACAQIVKNAQATPALNVRANKLDRMEMDYFSDTLIDATVQKLLAPYVAQRLP